MGIPRIEIISFAQNGEDIVLHRAFRNKPPGFYVDAGSGHPTKGSVTKNLHDRLGWSGLDIEPQPQLANVLASERCRSKVVNAALAPSPSDRTARKFYSFPSDWALSTLDAELAQKHIAGGLNAEEYDIPCLSLNTILDTNRVRPGFELLKLDIEGMDFEVLCDFDFSHWHPSIIMTESLCPKTKKRVGPALDQLMSAHGYREVLFDGINSFYLSKSRRDLEEHLSVPANSRDFYITYYWWKHLPEDFRSQYADYQEIR
jgi:FkbM family methyltransferase